MYLLFDIGATKIRIAVSRDGKSFDTPEIIETPMDFMEGMDAIEKVALSMSDGEQFEIVAGGVPGPLKNDKKYIGNTPNLAWKNKPLAEELHKRFKTSVILDVDANVIGLGEATVGAGRGQRIVAYYTVSTGVGGARIVNGKIDEHAIGFEPGHQIIDAGGALCRTCGPQGDLEAYVGGAALKQRHNKEPKEIEDEKIWEEMAQFLAYGLNNTIIHWSPDVVVVGGGLIIHGDGIKLERVKFHLKEVMHAFPTLPEIKQATLGDFGGLYGALELIKQKNGN